MPENTQPNIEEIQIKEEVKNIEEVKSNSSEVWSFLKDLWVIIAIVLLIRTFIAMPFQINGESMADSYYNREFIIVDRLSYRVWEPKRGDVIVFKPGVNKDREFFLKRIIAIAGDKIKIAEGKVYLSKNGLEEYKELDEQYLNISNNGFTVVSQNKTLEKIIPEGQYFVMWDNRTHSTDSRSCFSNCTNANATNFVPKENITGRLFIDLWYFNFTFSRDKFWFNHPEIDGLKTYPRFLSSPRGYDYE